MALGSSQVTITTAANFIPERWGPAVIKAVEESLVLWDKCWDWFEEGKGLGDIIHVPGVSNLTTAAKSANTEVVLSAPTEGVTNLTIGEHQHCAFLIEDMAKVQMSFNLLDHYTKKAGYSVREVMDTAIADRIASLSQIVGAAGVDLGDADIRDAIELLDLAIAPEEWRYLVLYPTQKNALFAIEKYFRADMRGDGASSILKRGQFGAIYGVPVYVTTNLGTSGGSRLNALFQKETWAKALQLGPRVQSDYLIEYLGNLTVVDVTYGSIEARDTFGVWMRS